MKITKDNLNEVMFENQDARLLIEDVVTHTGASLYYYHDMEITVQRALDIWYKAMGAEEEEDRPVPLFDFSNKPGAAFCIIYSIMADKRLSWRKTDGRLHGQDCRMS